MSATPVEQIKQRLSILDVVGSYVVLQKAGKSYKGKSPFTQEKTPSFFVSPERGMYYCFSTSKGGDMFTFVQEMEGVDFKGALKILAERAGVALQPVDPKVADIRERLFALLEDATAWYVRSRLEHPSVDEYLRARGVKTETMEKWRIGYAPKGWRNLHDALIKKGYSDDLMVRAGLAKYAESREKGVYDVFRDRIMFPITDSSGRVVGFSGRLFGDDPAAPKYVNSPETELYQKSDILFGYYHAKQGIRTYDFSLVVEGQFDLVLSHQAGYTNTVALSGTALTAAHVSLLQRLSSRIVLALDADRAGIASVRRSSEVLLRRGMDVKVARVVGGKDPADLVKEDPKLLRSVVGSAVSLVEFLLAVTKDSSRDEKTFRLRVREEVVPVVTLLPSKIEQEHYEEVIAQALNVTKDAIHADAVRAQEALDRNALIEPKERPHVDDLIVEQKRPERRLDDLIAHLYGTVLYLEGRGSESATSQAYGARLRAHLEKVLGHGSMQSLTDLPPERQNEAVFRVEIAAQDRGELSWESIGAELHELATLLARRALRGVRDRLAAAERAGDKEESERILRESHTINEQLKQLAAHNVFLDT